MATARIHPTAEVAPTAQVGDRTRVWNQAQIRDGARIGADCIIGKNVYIDAGVAVGDRVKIQNNSSVYHGITIEDGVFIGPHVCFCNDVLPRAIRPDGELKGEDDWVVGTVTVRYGASVGAGSIIVPNVIIGTFALVGAGSVVTHSVPDHALVYGNPARQHGYVCRCGRKLSMLPPEGDFVRGKCPQCQQEYRFSMPENL